MRPAGPIHVRRRRGDGTVDAWEFNLEAPQAWEAFQLCPNDLIVVQWQIADA
jgi:hypothetical protein